MTDASLLGRAGRLDCVCATPLEGAADNAGTGRLAAAFAFSVLSQVLTLSVLPLAGLSMSPGTLSSMLPYAAYYAGAAIASFPAAILLDAIGRRAAFSLGASLGAAGGLVLAWSLINWHFAGLVLGAFWLGTASGFSLFYRHAAVPLGGSQRSLLLVVGAASLAALVAPTLTRTAEALSVPHTFVGIAVAASLAHVAALLVTATLPFRPVRSAAPALPARTTAPVLWPTLIGAVAWFAMTSLMGATPLAMLGCGLEEGVSGAVAWHVLAMYAPSLALALSPRPIAPGALCTAGLALLVASAAALAIAGTIAGFSAATILLGVGWSLAMLGTTLLIHRDGPPPRWVLGLHDGALLAAALAGALFAGMVV